MGNGGRLTLCSVMCNSSHVETLVCPAVIYKPARDSKAAALKNEVRGELRRKSKDGGCVQSQLHRIRSAKAAADGFPMKLELRTFTFLTLLHALSRLSFGASSKMLEGVCAMSGDSMFLATTL